REEASWREVPMAYLVNDRWQGSFEPRRTGTYEFAVQAWVDHFKSWEHDLERRDRADAAAELEEGAKLVDEAGRRAPAADAARLGFHILYLPPIHPIGRAFRKGRNNTVSGTRNDVGSPWAIGSEEGGHKSINPDLGTLDDFRRLVKATKRHGMEIALDIAFQCSPDHPYVREHPEWLRQRPDGSIRYAENPPKKYQDIYPLNFESADWRALWQELKRVFEFWIEHGVTIFRVDHPHTKPFPFWAWALT